MAAIIPMIAITISSSMSVKPDVFLCVEYFRMTITANGKQLDYSIIQVGDIVKKARLVGNRRYVRIYTRSIWCRLLYAY